jgi:hypothetical protein
MPHSETASDVPPSADGSKTKPLFFLLKVGISLLLLAYVIWKSGLNTAAGREELLQTLRQANPFWFAVSLLVGGILNVISSWKWQVLLRSKGIEVSLARLIAYYFIGRFFNMFLPTSVGGDVVRVLELSRHSGAKYEALASVMVDRLSGMATLVVIAAVTVLLHPYNLHMLNLGILCLAVMTAAIFWLILDQRILPLLSKLRGSRIIPLADQILSKLGRLQQALRDYKDTPAALMQVFAISSLFYFMAIVNVWSSALIFSSEVSFISMLLAVPAIMVVMNLPFSIGGLGLMEASFAFFFPLFGCSATLALSTALFMRFKTIAYGLIGGLLHLGRLRTEPVKNGGAVS